MKRRGNRHSQDPQPWPAARKLLLAPVLDLGELAAGLRVVRFRTDESGAALASVFVMATGVLISKEGDRMKTPPVVSPEDWRAAREQLLIKEKELTRARDALAAERRG